MVNWRLYYADRTTYSNEDGAWAGAPGEGVLIVVVRDPTGVYGRFWLHHHDYYVFRPDLGDDRPYPTNDPRDVMLTWGLTPPIPFPAPANVHDLLVSEALRGHFRFGRVVSDTLFGEVAVVAAADTDFPTGTSPQRRDDDPGRV